MAQRPRAHAHAQPACSDGGGQGAQQRSESRVGVPGEPFGELRVEQLIHREVIVDHSLKMISSRVRERLGYLLVQCLAALLGEPRAQQPDRRARAREALEPRRRQHAQLDLVHARA